MECRHCKKDFPPHKMKPNRSCKNGISNLCKECDSQRVKEWRLRNKDKITTYRENHRENQNLAKKEKRRFLQSLNTCEHCKCRLEGKRITTKFCDSCRRIKKNKKALEAYHAKKYLKSPNQDQ